MELNKYEIREKYRLNRVLDYVSNIIEDLDLGETQQALEELSGLYNYVNSLLDKDLQRKMKLEGGEFDE
jgi:flagellin-specific chaperone FliS